MNESKKINITFLVKLGVKIFVNFQIFWNEKF
jgi:hypothetical protein